MITVILDSDKMLTEKKGGEVRGLVLFCSDGKNWGAHGYIRRRVVLKA